jgi:hypothetical protein
MRQTMRVAVRAAGLIGTVAVAGCAVTPETPAPSVLALPAPNRSLAQFQQQDAGCRNYALQQSGYVSPNKAATQSALGSAAVGTALGAVAGTLIGAAAGVPGVGAAAGAGGGLLLGTAAGANNAQASALSVQQRYDMAYIQCTVADGNQVQGLSMANGGGYPGGGPAAYGGPYAYPAPYAYPYPAFYGPYWGPGYWGWGGPGIAIGFGGGWGWRGGGWHGGGWHH